MSTGNPYSTIRKVRAAERAWSARLATVTERTEAARDTQQAARDIEHVRAMLRHPSFTRQHSEPAAGR
jgi:hypothetical protein